MNRNRQPKPISSKEQSKRNIRKARQNAEKARQQYFKLFTTIVK